MPSDTLDQIAQLLGAASNVTDRSAKLAYLAEARMLAVRAGRRLGEMETMLGAMERAVGQPPEKRA